MNPISFYFGVVTGERDKLNKTITYQTKESLGYMPKVFKLDSPVIKLKVSVEFFAQKYNYIKIDLPVNMSPKTTRTYYYYILRAEANHDGTSDVYLKLDYLETFKDYIKLCKAVVTRSDSIDANTSAITHMLKVVPSFETIEFPYTFPDTPTYLLTVRGGV